MGNTEEKAIYDMKRQYETKVKISPIQLNFSGSDDTDAETVSDMYFDDSYTSAISLEQVTSLNWHR